VNRYGSHAFQGFGKPVTVNANERRNWMWSEACALIARAERLHQDFFQPDRSTPAWEPPIDILETDRRLWIIVALPGVEPPDLQVAVEGNALRIVGVRRLPEIARGAAVHRLEIPYGRFERRIRLPEAALEMGQPELKDGCLFLSLTKRI
jgi:HSP20 family molecular chaperone IbpA